MPLKCYYDFTFTYHILNGLRLASFHAWEIFWTISLVSLLLLFYRYQKRQLWNTFAFLMDPNQFRFIPLLYIKKSFSGISCLSFSLTYWCSQVGFFHLRLYLGHFSVYWPSEAIWIPVNSARHRTYHLPPRPEQLYWGNFCLLFLIIAGCQKPLALQSFRMC